MRTILERFFLRDTERETRREAFWRGLRRTVDPLYGHGTLATYRHEFTRGHLRHDALHDMGQDWERVGDDLEAAVAARTKR